MSKEREEYTCTVSYTEGCEERLTNALVEIYYKRELEISTGQRIRSSLLEGTRSAG